jgi:imidazolonepropionase-like amidohydrolase
MRRLDAALVFLSLGAAAATAAEGFALVGATVVDASGVLTDGIVVVAKGRIESVGPRSHVRLPKGVTLQDGRGLFVVAGPPWSAATVALVEARVKAGSSAREAVLAALRDRSGRLASGEPADFVVLEKDPLVDPAHLRALVRGVRDGRELSADERRTAER